jgi:arylsulfatase A-like enzyme
VRTPVLDRLAAEGLRFTHAFANTPVCTPSRGSLLTGLWPARHRALSNDLPVDSRPETPSIARALRADGYRCGYIGKWHLGGWPRDRFIPPGPERLGFDDLWAAWNCNHRYFEGRYHRDESPQPVRLDSVYEPAAQTDLALEWLDGRLAAGEPFCLFLSYGPPHSPYRPIPEEMAGTYDPARLTLRPNCADTPEVRRDTADYYAHITALDAQIGRLVSLLEARVALDDTLVVYSSDHGTMLGSHGRVNKQQPWDESVNVPLIMRLGRLGARLPQSRRGAVDDLLLGIVDYAPTLLALLGQPVPPAMQGRDLSEHVLAEQTGARPARPTSVFLQELICCDQAIPLGLRPWRGIRTTRHTYARDLDGPWVLYDNAADPFQQRNLAVDGSAAALRASLEAELQGWMARCGDALEPAEALLARRGLAEAWAAREAHFDGLRARRPG